ncbi:GNAT family N-acetyltransferase [Streptomyces griseoincarnatus]
MTTPRMRYERFDPFLDTHVQDVTRLFRGYVLEEFERTGKDPDGFPVATYLNTVIAYAANVPVALCSVDPTRKAVELLYVRPEVRRLGLGRHILTWVRDQCPGQMKVKPPVTPACAALSASLGIEVATVSDDERRRRHEHARRFEQLIRKRCRHKRRRTATRKVCPLCMRAYVEAMPERIVGQQVTAMRMVANYLPA